MAVPLIQPSFAAGELAPGLHARTDLAKYQIGLATCLNWFIRAQGGAYTRPGTMFVDAVGDHAVRHRLIPFQFRTSPSGQNYALVFGHQTMRVIMNGAYVLDGGGSIYELATPYAAADLPTLKFVQSADVMTLTHPGYQTRDLTRSGHASWSLSTITFAATIAAPTSLVAGPSSAHSDETYEYVVTAISADTGEESLPSNVATCQFRLQHDWDPTAGDYINLQWVNVAGAESYNVYKKRNGIFGYIGNAGDGTLLPFGFQDDKIQANTSNTPPGARNPFSGAGDYPGCVAYHDERRAFAASANKPQTIWMTGSGNYRNMNVSTPSKDDDAITRTLVSREVNEIRHLVSMNVLVALTSGAEWKIWPGSQADVLTPAAFSAKPQSYTGCSHVPPILVNDSLLFIQEQGSIVRDLRYQFSTDGYAGVDLSLLASHLFEGRTIMEWAYAQVPYSIIWAVRDDGVLLGFAYLKEQEVYAWSKHVTDGAFESVCSISEDGEDAAYVIVRRIIGGQTRRYIERLARRRFDMVRDQWALDCALAYDGNNPVADHLLKISGALYTTGATVTLQASGHTPFSAPLVGRKYELRGGPYKVRVTLTAYTDGDTMTGTLDTDCPVALQNLYTSDWALLAGTVSGLDHIEGKTVHILGDGNVMPPQVVDSGAVALEREVSKAIVGLPYDCDLETLNIDAGQPTVQGRQKRVVEVGLKVEKSRGLQVGPVAKDPMGNPIQGTPGRLIEIKERSTEAYGEPIQSFTGERHVIIDPSWNSNGRIFVRNTPGLHAAVLAVIPRVDVGG